MFRNRPAAVEAIQVPSGDRFGLAQVFGVRAWSAPSGSWLVRTPGGVAVLDDAVFRSLFESTLL